MRPMRHTRSRLATLGAALALGAGGLTGCSTDGGSAAVDPEPSASSPTTDSPTPASPTPSGTPSTDAGGQPPSGADATVTVPVYFTGDTPQGLRLYREFQPAPAGDPLLGAATALTSGGALDPDYSSLLTGMPITAVTASPEAITVTVAGDWDAQLPAVRGAARIARQSLVYTVQGAAQSRAPVVVQTPDGTPYELFGADTTAGLDTAGELRVLALVNVSDPAQGSTVSGGFTATGVASSFEATVPWQVLDAAGEPVVEGAAQAEGWLDGLYPWTAEVDVSGLAPGEYTFVARTDDPSGGTEGGGPTEDTKTITVS